MAENIKILSTEVLSDNFFPLKKIQYEFKKKNGTSEELSREVYLSTNGAAVLLYNIENENENVVLTKQFRLPTYLNENNTGILIEACAGLVEENEDPKHAIIREIEEETGYRVTDVKKIFEMYMSPGAVAEMVYFFIAEYKPGQKVNEGGGLDEENEDIQVIELPFEEAYYKIQSGEIRDAKTALLLQYARIYLFKGEKVFDIL